MNLLECYVTNITYIGERNEYNCHKIVADFNCYGNVQKQQTTFSAYWDGEMWTDVNDDPVNGVIAWQPLPEQYKSKVKTKE